VVTPTRCGRPTGTGTGRAIGLTACSVCRSRNVSDAVRSAWPSKPQRQVSVSWCRVVRSVSPQFGHSWLVHASDRTSTEIPYSSAVHASRSVNCLNAQKLWVLALVSIDQCVSSTSVKPPIYTVPPPSSYSRSSRSRHSASWAWSRRRVRLRYSRRIRLLLYCPSSSLDCNRAISRVVSRKRANNWRPSYRYCSPVVVVQATRLFAPMSRAAFSSASGVSRASSETVTGCEARKVLSVSSYHNSRRPWSS